MPEARDPHTWQAAAAAPVLQRMLGDIHAAADRFRGTDIPCYPYRYYRTYDITGSRQEYEVYYFGRRKRLNAFALLSLLEPCEENLTELSDIIWAICDESSWCLPAHMEGHSMRIVNGQPMLNEKGMYTGTQSQQHHMIDLFGSETGFALAEITTLLYDKLDPFLSYRARSLIFERMLLPYLGLDTDRRGWENGTANWTAVCAGSVGAAALYLVEEPMLLGRIVYRVMSSMETFLQGYGEDGACLEGLSYWNYGFGFFVYFAELLKARTGGAIDLLQGDYAEKIRKIAAFQQKCFMHGRKAVSFSDAPCENWYVPGLIHYLHRLYPEAVVPPLASMATYGDDGCHRWASDLRNLVWTDPAWRETQAEQDAFYRMDDAQWVLIKHSGMAFACKGGHNDEPHNHNDVGSFMLNVHGDTFLADVGVGMHSRQYFGPERYSFFAASSRGHSLPIIDGQYQLAGRDCRATAFTVQRGGAADTVAYEIGAAYGDDNIQSIRRSFVVDKAQNRCTLHDDFGFVRAPGTLVERMVTMLPPVAEATGTVRIAGEHGVALLRYDPEKWTVTVHSEDFKPSRTDVNTAYCIDFAAVAPGTRVRFELEITTMVDA